MNITNKHLIKIIQDYIDYKHLFMNELLDKTYWMSFILTGDIYYYPTYIIYNNFDKFKLGCDKFRIRKFKNDRYWYVK